MHSQDCERKHVFLYCVVFSILCNNSVVFFFIDSGAVAVDWEL